MKFNINRLRRQKSTGHNRSEGLAACRMPTLRIVVALGLLMSAPSIRAQVLSLDSILTLIDKQNPALQTYDARAKAINAYAAGAGSWMAPMVGVGRWMTPYAAPPIENAASQGAWMLSVEQDIPNPAKLRANKHYLESKADVEARAREVQFNALRSEAKSWYYRWLVAEDKLDVLGESERIIDLMLKLARIRYPYNQGSLGNIYKAEGRLHEVRNAMLDTHADIAEATYRLKALAVIPAGDSIMIDTTTSVVFAPRDFHYDTARLGEARSDVQQIQETIETMRLNQQLQRYQAKPDVSLRFNHMQGVAGMPSQFTAMVMVSIPIAPWANKAYKAEVKGLAYEIEALKRNREAILTESRGMLAGLTNEIIQMQKQIDNYDARIIPALRKNYETLMLAYEENREQLPIVVDAWEALNAAQMAYLNKREEYYLTIVRYERELEE